MDEKMKRQEDVNIVPKRKPKMDPFAKAKVKAQQRREEQEQMEKQRQVEAKVIAGKKIERKVRAKQMMQRTKKTGQPVMKFVIQGMLDKIRKDPLDVGF
jgi:hypothetical protein